MIADLEPPKDNPTAPYVLTEQSPEYHVNSRPAFTKENASHYGRKGGLITGAMAMERARASREAKRKLKIQEAAVEPKVSALRRMQRRALAQAMAENDAKKQALFMRSFQVAFDAEQTLLGQSHKSTKKPHLAHVSPSPKVEPLPSGNQGVNPATVRPASEHAPIAPVSPIPPKPSEIDDCPF